MKLNELEQRIEQMIEYGYFDQPEYAKEQIMELVTFGLGSKEGRKDLEDNLSLEFDTALMKFDYHQLNKIKQYDPDITEQKVDTIQGRYETFLMDEVVDQQDMTNFIKLFEWSKVVPDTKEYEKLQTVLQNRGYDFTPEQIKLLQTIVDKELLQESILHSATKAIHKIGSRTNTEFNEYIALMKNVPEELITEVQSKYFDLHIDDNLTNMFELYDATKIEPPSKENFAKRMYSLAIKNVEEQGQYDESTRFAPEENMFEKIQRMTGYAPSRYVISTVREKIKKIIRNSNSDGHLRREWQRWTFNTGINLGKTEIVQGYRKALEKFGPGEDTISLGRNLDIPNYNAIVKEYYKEETMDDWD